MLIHLQARTQVRKCCLSLVSLSLVNKAVDTPLPTCLVLGIYVGCIYKMCNAYVCVVSTYIAFTYT